MIINQKTNKSSDFFKKVLKYNTNFYIQDL